MAVRNVPLSSILLLPLLISLLWPSRPSSCEPFFLLLREAEKGYCEQLPVDSPLVVIVDKCFFSDAQRFWHRFTSGKRYNLAEPSRLEAQRAFPDSTPFWL